MIRLITQFDNEKSKLSLATPTCGCCCCCCCCCIVSTFATASISARNFGNYVAKKLPNEPKKIKTARNFGFLLPLGLLMSLGLGLGFVEIIIGLDSLIGVITFGIMYLIVMTSSLKKKINLSGITSRVIFFSIFLGVFETLGFFIGMYAIVYLGSLYVVGAIIISILLICWAFGKKYDNLEKLKNSDNVDNENSSNNQTNEVIDDTQTMKINNDNLNDILVEEKFEADDEK